MTNMQYRKSRGTHKKFRTTPAQAQAIWFEMNREAILAGRLRRNRSHPWRHVPDAVDEGDGEE